MVLDSVSPSLASNRKSRLQERRRMHAPTLNVQTNSGSLTRNDLQASHEDFIAKDFDVFNVLGHGSAGVVKRAMRRSDHQDVALKVVRTADPELLAAARREYEVLREISHPSIICAFDFFVTVDRAVLVMELFDGFELDVAVRNQANRHFSEFAARELFLQLIKAVDFLHKRRIIHRDIKGANMLVSRDYLSLKLLDFNTAHKLTHGSALTMTGTHEYAAPEVLLGESPSELSDVWCAGLCLHLMLAGRLPRRYDHFASIVEFVDAVTTRPVDLCGRRWQDVSEECKVVLSRCLDVNKTRRPATMTLLSQQRWLFADYVAGEKPRPSNRESSIGTSRSTCSGWSGTLGSSSRRASSVPLSPSSSRSSCSPCLPSFEA